MRSKYSGIMAPIFSHACAKSHSAGGLEGSESSFLIFNSSNTPVYRMYSIIDSSSFVNDELARAWLKLAASMMGLLDDNMLFT